MSSHREAPQIAQDPVADSTDLYTFVSPDKPTTVTIIACYVPLEAPDGGPNFYEFGQDVLYEIKINNRGNASADLVYQFRFSTEITNPDTFLYNTGPITSLTTQNWNRRQSYSVSRVKGNRQPQMLAKNVPCPPCNIGPLSTPTYPALALAAVQSLPGGGQVFAGQRADGFYVDLGATFDLAVLRPFEQDHTTFGLQNTGLGAMAAGINSLKGANVHVIALQLPIGTVTANGSAPKSATASSVIGVWTTASRQKSRILGGHQPTLSGPFTQVPVFGNPLVNEVIIPMALKDGWNTQNPSNDSEYLKYFANPELAQLLPTLYPGVFPNLKTYNGGSPTRADLVAILLTGIPSGVVPGFQNSTGKTQADMLRLNLAIPPTTSGQSNLGLIGDDAAGFPNGRRVFDDVTTIELRALAGATLPLVDKSFTADTAAGGITPGLTSGPTDLTADTTESYLPSFPYLGLPHQGFSTPSS